MLLRIASLGLLTFTQSVSAQTGDGAAVYKRCAVCHLPTGAGVPGAFPPLTHHLGPIASTLRGREYLVTTISSGLIGEIQIGGQTYRGIMPAQAGLSDSAIAAVLNHILSSWSVKTLRKGWVPFTADEVRTVRAKHATLSMGDVHVLRRNIPKKKEGER